jgi:hypothetical protein
METRRWPTLLAAFATMGAAESQCNQTTTGVSVGNAGAYDASAAANGAVPPGNVAPPSGSDGAPSSSVSTDATTSDTGPSSSDDDSSSPDASSPPSGPATEGGGSDVALGAPTTPGWATWAMPNSPSSGLPHPQSYDTSVDTIAVDRVTGLTWQRDAYIVSSAQNGMATQLLEQSAAYCTGLGLAGFHDWRVPSRIELVSIMDFTRFPAENTAVFPPTTAELMSSSYRDMGTAKAALAEALLGDGNTAGGELIYFYPFEDMLQGPTAVRCVRGAFTPAGAHYTIANGIVEDNWTGLSWIQSPSALMEPSSVGSYCTSQTLGGGGWRAPSENELETLVADFANTDTTSLDPAAFAALSQLDQGMGSSNVQVEDFDASGDPTDWLGVSMDGNTFFEHDVPPTLDPLPGTEPYIEYWVYAECVR